MAAQAAQAAGAVGAAMSKTVPQLYRDCLRLVRHIAPPPSRKGAALKAMVRTEFRKHADVEDAAAVEDLKAAAVRGLSNYVLYEAGVKDAKMRDRMDSYAAANKAELAKTR